MSLWLPRRSPALLTRAHSRYASHPPPLIFTLARNNSAQVLITPLSRRWQTSAAHSPSSSVGGPIPNPTEPSAPSNSESNPKDEKHLASSKASPPVPKPPLATRAWKKVKHEAAHYWHGSKLLVSEVRISTRLQWKILHGESLTRRERRQVRIWFLCLTLVCITLTITLAYFS
jgi:LETM1 and EF-hand domain-containing protein 1, mitochondrial